MVSFSRLRQALDFLATNLEGRRHDVIADACIASESLRDKQPVAGTLPSKRDSRIRAIKRLADRHGELDLRKRYVGREFPADGSDYTVGGHDDGHLHLDFVKLDGDWMLKNIWICR